MMNRFRKHFIVFLLILPNLLVGKNTKLFINRGILNTVLETPLPYLAFNSSTEFSGYNTIIEARSKEVIQLEIFNNDTIAHQLFININSPIQLPLLAPKSSQQISFSIEEEGAYQIYDQLNFPNNKYLGLSTMICIKKDNKAKVFFWNLKEHQTLYNQKIIDNQPVDWKKYDPEFFTINGASFPLIHDDTTAKIYGRKGDTIRIYLLNSGESMHSIHFHGFHCKVISSNNKLLINSSKDTFKVNAMDTFLLEMVPDKVGEYAVHDHNLMATTAKLRHPSGMMLIMLIE